MCKTVKIGHKPHISLFYAYLLEWKCNLGRYAEETFCENLVSQATLPNGDGEIKAIANGQIEVTVRWSDSLGDDHTVVLFTGL